MIESLYIGATGMHSQQTSMDVIANNIANVNTSGFKKNKIDFEDLMYRSLANTNGVRGPLGRNELIGIGSTIASSSKIFSQGEVKNTDRQLDVAVQGTGMFEVLMPDGSYAYTRNGSLQIDSDGMLTNGDGYPLTANIRIPADATDLTIQTDGKVFATVSTETKPVEIGQIELANFISPAGLVPQGDNMYVPSVESGNVYYSYPGENGFGQLQQGYLEGSNVELIEELLNLILTQRAYEVNSRVVQASDEMLSLANGLRR